MAPPDRVYRSSPQMPYSPPTPSPEPFGILTTLGHLGTASRPAQPDRGILGFMLPPDAEDEGNSRGLTRADSHAAESPRGPASMDEVSPAEIMNLPPYERWLVTLPDDSPELVGQPDPRVGKAPSNQPQHLIVGSGAADTLIGGAGEDHLNATPFSGVGPQAPSMNLIPPKPTVAELLENKGRLSGLQGAEGIPGSMAWNVARRRSAYPGGGQLLDDTQAGESYASRKLPVIAASPPVHRSYDLGTWALQAERLDAAKQAAHEEGMRAAGLAMDNDLTSPTRYADALNAYYSRGGGEFEAQVTPGFVVRRELDAKARYEKRREPDFTDDIAEFFGRRPHTDSLAAADQILARGGTYYDAVRAAGWAGDLELSPSEKAEKERKAQEQADRQELFHELTVRSIEDQRDTESVLRSPSPLSERPKQSYNSGPRWKR